MIGGQRCQECGHTVSADDRFCSVCGTELSGSLASEEQEVLPSIAEKLETGQPLLFEAPQGGVAEGEEKAADRTVDATWIEALAARPARQVQVPVVIENAIIIGTLDLDYAAFEYEVSVTGTEFRGEVRLSRATFRRGLTLDGSHFQQGVRFRGAHSLDDISCIHCVFDGEADFEGLQVDGHAFFGPDDRAKDGQSGGPPPLDAAAIGPAGGAVSLTGSGPVPAPAVRPGTFGKKFSLLGATIKGDAVFNGVQFGGEADFWRAQIGGGAYFRPEGTPVHFWREVTFDTARIGGNAFFRSAEFHGEANFRRLQVSGSLSFLPQPEGAGLPVRFWAEAVFVGAHVQANLGFRGTWFKGSARFWGLKVDGETRFTSDSGEPTQFAGKTDFAGAALQGDAFFNGVQFVGEARFPDVRFGACAYFLPDEHDRPVFFGDGCTFQAAIVQVDIHCKRARFAGRSSFAAMQVTGLANFQDATFGSETNFTLARFHSATSFQGATFEVGERDGEVVAQPEQAKQVNVFFQDALFTSHTTFDGVTFESGVRPSFSSTRFAEYAGFLGARFAEPADFRSVIAEIEIEFTGTTFNGLWLAGARLGVLSFREELTRDVPDNASRQFESGSAVDLRGCTYQRISVAWQELLDHLEPYDRQPFAQLEGVLHTMGRSRDAEQVHVLQWQREQRQLRTSDPWLSLGYWVYGIVAHYGVRPYRLAVASLVLLVLGVLVFSRPHAVVLQADKSRTPPAYTVSIPDSLGVTLNQFLPVAIPGGSQWKPSDRGVEVGKGHVWAITYSSWASVERILGWILVPLGVASVSGLLYRRS